MFTFVITCIVYLYLLKKFRPYLKLYELKMKERKNQTNYYIDYCDEPICFR